MKTGKEREANRLNSAGFIVSIILVLAAAFMSSVVYEAPQAQIPRIDVSGRSVTGYAASSFTTTCTDDSTIIKTTANFNALAAKFDSTDPSYTKKVCSQTLGTGHACKYATTTAIPTTTTQPTHCLPPNNAWDGDESDLNCGGSCSIKCQNSYYCWGNSDCSSGICWFDSATMAKRNAATPPITKDQRLQPISTNIQYQGVCVSTAPSSGGIVGGAIVDITGEQFSLPSLSSFPSSPSIWPSHCSDGVLSGDESAIDCGGSCLTKCANNLNCNTHSDCSSSYCDNGICIASPLLTTPTTPTLKLPPITSITTTSSTPINQIIRIGSDNTVEKIDYSGPAATTTTTATPTTYTGTITTCNTSPGTSRCTPSAGPSGTKSLGIIDEFNSFGQMYNGYAIYVTDSVVGEVVKNPTCSVSQGCATSVCSKGTLQFEINEYDQDNQPVFRKYGVCSDKKIKLASCSERVKGRTCSTNPPESGLTKLSGHVLDIINNADGGRTFIYYDLYIQSQEAAPTTTPITYTDVCFGDGPYHYEDRTGKTKGDCDAGSCIFTLSAATGARVADCSTANAYSTSVCSGGYCVGTDCGQPGCRTENSCSVNPNCAWDTYEKNPTTPKCKSITGVCNQFGVTLCTPAAFRSGDYSCLYKEGSYYTQSCEGKGQFGFWVPVEVY